MSEWQEKAAHRFPRSHQRSRIYGDGAFALCVGCAFPGRILLFPTADARQQRLIRMDFGCGASNCIGKHDCVDL